jgi:NAD(P)H-hydrate epimerase
MELASRTDAVALGPGLSLDPDTQELIRGLIADVPLPMVIDADALSALAGHPDVLDRASGPRALTPHPGEMARLCELTTEQVQADRVGVARALAQAQRLTVVLKGARTVVADPDGTIAVVPTGNPGMATGGTVTLTGKVGAFARGLDAVNALSAGCFHGLPAISAAGEESLIAGDLIESTPAAMTRPRQRADREARRDGDLAARRRRRPSENAWARARPAAGSPHRRARRRQDVLPPGSRRSASSRR